ncbi:hypothetical protein Bca4012_031610 [Brassica carinata]
MYKREKVVSFSIILMIPLLILTEKINANAAKDLERRCRGVSVMLNVCVFARSHQRDAECLRLCKESARKTGFRRGTCTVKDNNHYCHCYNHVCAPPQPPRKGPPPPV